MLAPRVRLFVPDVALLDAAIDGPAALTRALEGCEDAEGWEVFPDALPATRDSLASDPESARWGTRLFVLDKPSMLVGWGGFKGPPADGIVELGYSVAPALRRRGIATEAVREMLRDAFSETQVRAVIAHTLAEPGPSTKVLEKTGFVYDGEVNDEDDGRLWRWRRGRLYQPAGGYRPVKVREVSPGDRRAVKALTRLEQDFMGGHPLFWSAPDVDVRKQLSGRSAFFHDIEHALFAERQGEPAARR